ncbi:hypothetical protein, partial [Caulobacter sp. 17J65-9]|uniref:hypothetical protein n=1 Tax=Caulobacter sp. 17J65-9 TaxID=2709382 RepID=UPI0013C7B3EA
PQTAPAPIAAPAAPAAEGGVRFTDLPADDVAATIAQAAQATGASHPYLVATAHRESRGHASAAASNSSAQGLFQFVDATWLEMIDRHGAEYGLAREAALIDIDADGKPRVADPTERKRILALRDDPRVSALMAGELAHENADKLEARLDRAPTDGELYLAHFLGPRDAARLIVAAKAQPGRAAHELCPTAARSNRSVFYRGAQARTAAEVVSRLA